MAQWRGAAAERASRPAEDVQAFGEAVQQRLHLARPAPARHLLGACGEMATRARPGQAPPSPLTSSATRKHQAVGTDGAGSRPFPCAGRPTVHPCCPRDRSRMPFLYFPLSCRSNHPDGPVSGGHTRRRSNHIRHSYHRTRPHTATPDAAPGELSQTRRRRYICNPDRRRPKPTNDEMDAKGAVRRARNLMRARVPPGLGRAAATRTATSARGGRWAQEMTNSAFACAGMPSSFSRYSTRT